ncbi:MAG TPA: ATP-binding protein [Vicinamibacterales bacterium]
MRPECVILIGLPGSGKSTFYRQRLAATHELISKDLLPNVRQRQDRQDQLLRTTLARGASVAVDNTNVSPAERAAIIRIAQEYGARVVGTYIEATTREAVARNERRAGRDRVPKVAIFTCAKRLVAPDPEEGFDELHRYRVDPDGRFVEAE